MQPLIEREKKLRQRNSTRFRHLGISLGGFEKRDEKWEIGIGFVRERGFKYLRGQQESLSHNIWNVK
jgi:hypothetical protein